MNLPICELASIGRTATLAGWALIGSAFIVLVCVAVVTHRAFPDGLALLRVAMLHRTGRVVALLAWVWLGWHFFVRTTR